MQRWDRLNQRQQTLLEQIAAGNDLSSTDSVAHRNCARALQRRRLVNVTRGRGFWRAAITPAGHFYLAHGHHPDHPRYRPSPPATARRTAASTARRAVTVDEATGTIAFAHHLMDRLTEGDGLVRIERPDEPTRARYRRAIHAAKQHSLIPDGYQLRHTGRDRGDLVIRLYDLAHREDWDRFRVATHRRLTTDEEIIAAVQQDPTHLPVSPHLLPRALDVIRRLAVTARYRGHALVANIRGPHPRLLLRLHGAERAVQISEDHDQIPHVPTDEEQRLHQLQPWVPLPATDRVPNGRLVLQISRRRHGTPHTWTDSKRSRLDTRLGAILAEVEAGHRAEQHPAAEPDPVVTGQLELWHRREAAERARWEQARAAATVQAVDMLRTRRFRAAFDTWVAAQAIRGFCAALEAATPVDPNGRQNLACWIAWARSKADLLDPTTNPTLLADVDFAIAPDTEDIAPFIGQWSATAPHPGYRDEQTRTQHERVRGYDTTWYRSMIAHAPEPATELTARGRRNIPAQRTEPDGFHRGQRWATG
ncbi:hypothetical protein [Phytohabitans aurantiacus]|uniref:PE-PGRS family protein n=1 Tax=Phytohabitans aurantiacus TaxID=3016789 RepID=A0ABQ5RCP4_9ACTN|nr:hypothetical protein [Phytohabitans aurantiacus]GLI03937.1 hypothetical protein Pa4123_92180 [Phytohabitans aurantiacus]